MDWPWQPIETAPASDRSIDDPPRLFNAGSEEFGLYQSEDLSDALEKGRKALANLNKTDTET